MSHYGKPVVFKTLITDVEVLFLFPVTLGRLQPIYKNYNLDNEADALDWRLFRGKDIIQAKVRYTKSRKVTEREFNYVESERKQMLQRVALKAREIVSPKKHPAEYTIHPPVNSPASEKHETIQERMFVVAAEPQNTFAVISPQ